jgi:hypothetical protein
LRSSTAASRSSSLPLTSADSRAASREAFAFALETFAVSCRWCLDVVTPPSSRVLTLEERDEASGLYVASVR